MIIVLLLGVTEVTNGNRRVWPVPLWEPEPWGIHFSEIPANFRMFADLSARGCSIFFRGVTFLLQAKSRRSSAEQSGSHGARLISLSRCDCASGTFFLLVDRRQHRLILRKLEPCNASGTSLFFFRFRQVLEV